jgi:hypothetical protein
MATKPTEVAKDKTVDSAFSKDGNTWNVSGNTVDSYTQSLSGLEEGLPANNKSESNIHWSGSSYSGADIKIVVHMYEEITLAEEAVIQSETERLDELVAAYGGIASGGLSSICLGTQGSRSNREIIEEFLGSAGSGVISEISSFVNAIISRYPPGPQRTSEMMNAAFSNFETYSETIAALQDESDNLNQIKADQYSTFVLATAQTFSLQSHREKHPVRALGNANVKGFTRGNRTIAGSIIFTMFNEHALASLIRKMGSATNKFDPSHSAEDSVSSLLIDQLPPIDLTIVFANEYGSLSRGAVYGVEFMNSGITLSIEDLLTEEVVNFVARDYDPIISLGRVGIDRKQRGMFFNREGAPTTGSDLIFANKTSYTQYLDKLKVRRGLRNR